MATAPLVASHAVSASWLERTSKDGNDEEDATEVVIILFRYYIHNHYKDIALKRGISPKQGMVGLSTPTMGERKPGNGAFMAEMQAEE
ncbi:unnamed protein product [Phytomonas sp. EM1]|nr:unnamed protein product [Phytomonas sp. EM1]|eukprot:CCW60203.1 unnamed protein product [Phytomonas sp. isolate EM1]